MVKPKRRMVAVMTAAVLVPAGVGAGAAQACGGDGANDPGTYPTGTYPGEDTSTTTSTTASSASSGTATASAASTTKKKAKKSRHHVSTRAS